MRDPGTPRRNPFFEHGSDGSTDEFGMGWRDRADDADATGGPSSSSEMPDGAVGAFATLLALVEGLNDAQPEAAEHLVAAAHEVVLTVKVLVDATEAVLAQQRSAMAARNAMRTETTDEPEVDLSDDEDAAPITVLHRDAT
jgi:hypothetical protein